MTAQSRIFLISCLALGACVADETAPPTEDGSTASPLIVAGLALQNGWTNAPFETRNAGLSIASGVVHLEGAIANGTSAIAFTLPSGFRPATNVYVPIGLCNAAKGRLLIQPSGVVSVQSEGPFTNAQCFSSLEGASFITSGIGLTPLTLLNGWTGAPFGTRGASVEIRDGMVRLHGAIANGTSSMLFTLPAAFRPATNVYLPIDLCGARKGRLLIQPNGDVSVQWATAFSDAQCFTSLDGAAFAQTSTGFATLTLLNGWWHAPYGTASAAASVIGGIVQLKGAIAGGTSGLAFTLPSGLRPATTTYVPVDLCNAARGRLIILPSGDAIVQANGAFSDAQCFTSLEGASFSIAQPGANLFAVVDAAGNAVTGNRVQSITHYGPGRYEVTFTQDVSQCSYVATAGNAHSQALIAYTAGGHLGPQGVYVETKNQGGGLTDGPFHLLIACDAPGIRHAVVGYQANLVRASSGTSLRFLGFGRYAITFESPVDSCAYLASVGDPASALVFNPSGVYTGSYTDPRTVYIETKNPGGGLQDGVPFHLAVICPQASSAQFAVVNSSGITIRSSPSTMAWRTSTGRYEVTGSQSISECATVATRGSTDTSVPFTPTTVEIIPGSTSTGAGIEIRTLLFFGGNLFDEAFHAATICSKP
jgi:hypothetical protein